MALDNICRHIELWLLRAQTPIPPSNIGQQFILSPTILPPSIDIEEYIPRENIKLLGIDGNQCQITKVKNTSS